MQTKRRRRCKLRCCYMHHLTIMSSNTMTAVQQAFSITEILEQCLHELPTRDLLAHAPRVCRLWHNTIVGSSLLQEDVFLRPVPANRDRILANSILRPPTNAPVRIQADLGKGFLIPRKEASWRTMLVSQPPQHAIHVRIKRDRRSHRSHPYSNVDRASFDEGVIWGRAGKGVTIGDCVFAMMELKAREVEIIRSEGWERVD